MKAKNILIVSCIAIFLIGIIGSLWQIFRPHGQTVQIIQDGEILHTVDLERSENRTIEVEYQGRKNRIQIENHEIFISDADCPDQICVKMGKLSNTPIICLPNKLVIKFTETDDIDAEVK